MRSKGWNDLSYQKPRSFARREAGASPTEFPQHCVHLVSPFAMFTLVPPIITEKFRSFSRGRSVTLMGVGEKGESTLFEKKGKKDPSIRSKTETHFGPMRNLQILSQNLFNHCMVDAPASLRTNDRGFCHIDCYSHMDWSIHVSLRHHLVYSMTYYYWKWTFSYLKLNSLFFTVLEVG